MQNKLIYLIKESNDDNDIQQLNEPPKAKPLQAAKSSIQSG